MVVPKSSYSPHSSTKTICVCPPETSKERNGGSSCGYSINGALKCPTMWSTGKNSLSKDHATDFAKL